MDFKKNGDTITGLINTLDDAMLFPDNGRHICLLYESQIEKEDSIDWLMEAAAINGQKCVCISGDKWGSLNIPHVGKQISGRVQFSNVNAEECFKSSGNFEPLATIDFFSREIQEAVSAGYKGLWLLCDMNWAADPNLELDKLFEYESELNDGRFGNLPCFSVCEYDISRFDPRTIKGVLRTHPFVIWKARLLKNSCFIPPDELLSPRYEFYEIRRWLNNLNLYEEEKRSLEESEARYRALIDLGTEVGEGIMMLQDTNKKEGIITFASEQCARILGYSVEEMLGKSLFPMISEKFREDCILRHRRKMNGESLPGLYEISIFGKNGIQIPVELTSASTIYRERPANVVYIRDISERRTLEKALIESESLYSSIFQATGAATCILDKNGEIVSANNGWEKVLGYKKEEIEGRKHFISFIHPDETQRLSDYFKLRPKVPAEVPEKYEARIMHKDGSVKFMVITARMIPGSDKRVISAMDITDIVSAEEKLKQSNQRYQALFENAPVAISEEDFSYAKQKFDQLKKHGVTNFKGYFKRNPSILYECFKNTKRFGTNRELINISDAKSSEEVFDSMEASYHQGTASWKAHSDTLTRLAEGQTRFSKEETIVTASGQLKHIYTSIVVAPGCEETLSRVYICFFDISKLKVATEELELYKNELEKLVSERTKKLEKETEKSRTLIEKINRLYQREAKLRQKLENTISERAKFTRFLVHELKTPLTPLLGSTEILLNKASGEELKRLALNIHRGAQSLNYRVNDLLDLARGEMGILQLNCTWIDPEALIKEVLSYMDIEFKRNDQKTDFKRKHECALVWADHERLKQVLLNLLENASKFTERKGTISVETEQLDGMLIIQIRDTGCGIEEKRRESIFEGYSAYEKPSDPEADMGIGLPLSRLLVSLHGGDLWVESEPGKGSIFSFSIPVREEVKSNL